MGLLLGAVSIRTLQKTARTDGCWSTCGCKILIVIILVYGNRVYIHPSFRLYLHSIASNMVGIGVSAAGEAKESTVTDPDPTL